MRWVVVRPMTTRCVMRIGLTTLSSFEAIIPRVYIVESISEKSLPKQVFKIYTDEQCFTSPAASLVKELVYTHILSIENSCNWLSPSTHLISCTAAMECAST